MRKRYFMALLQHAKYSKSRQETIPDRFAPATIRDFVPMIIVVLVLLLGGAWLWNTDNSGWQAVVALLVILLGLVNEIRNAARYWRVSMGVE